MNMSVVYEYIAEDGRGVDHSLASEASSGRRARRNVELEQPISRRRHPLRSLTDVVPVPATSNPACGFPALGFPACFAPRFMGPIMLDWLSGPTPAAGLGSDCTSRVRHRAIAYSTAASRSPGASGHASRFPWPKHSRAPRFLAMQMPVNMAMAGRNTLPSNRENSRATFHPYRVT